MSKASPSQQQVRALFTNRPILYMPGLALIFGINEAILLSQLLYWRGKGRRPDNSFYKTHDELYRETGLSRDKQDRAIKKLKSYGFLVTKNKGIPQKRHFYIDMDMLVVTITNLLETNKFKHLDLGTGIDAFQHSITEITQKTTAKNTSQSTYHVAHGREDGAEQISEILRRRFMT